MSSSSNFAPIDDVLTGTSKSEIVISCCSSRLPLSWVFGGDDVPRMSLSSRRSIQDCDRLET